MIESSARSVTFEVGADWPTPNACLRAADALDGISPARFGAILRAYALAEDARFEAHGPIRSLPDLTPTTQAPHEAPATPEEA